jgi:hypothetical protein
MHEFIFNLLKSCFCCNLIVHMLLFNSKITFSQVTFMNMTLPFYVSAFRTSQHDEETKDAQVLTPTL